MSAHLIVESKHNQVIAAGADRYFDHVRVVDVDGNEVLYWDRAAWREESTEAFEAILGVIAKVFRGEKVVKP